MAFNPYDPGNLVHVGALLFLISFMFRNQMLLRLFAILGDAFYALYYFLIADRPLWEAIVWSILNILVNVAMIYMIWRDTRAHDLNDDELNLFRNLRGLSPGQFRKLMQIGTWTRCASPERLTTEGQMPQALYYVLEGKVNIDKGGRAISAEPAIFIGELAYLRGKPATATVDLSPESLFVSWKHDDLNRVTSRSEELRAALAMLLNNDLAEKVARS